MILETPKVDIFYEKTGEGEPIILLHGNGESHKIFDKAAPLLAKHFTVYALDSRCHGESGKTEELHYDDMADDVACFIESLHIEKPIVYGFSDGGIVALILAMKYPSLASKLIISGVNLRPDGLKKSVLRRFKFLYFFTRSKKLKLMIDEPNIADIQLRKIEIPVELTCGSREIVENDHLRAITNNLPRGSMTVFLGESHSSYIVHNDMIAQFIIEICVKKENEDKK